MNSLLYLKTFTVVLPFLTNINNQKKIVKHTCRQGSLGFAIHTILSLAGKGNGRGNCEAPREWDDIIDFCKWCCPVPAFPSVIRTTWNIEKTQLQKVQFYYIYILWVSITFSKLSVYSREVYLTGCAISPLFQNVLCSTHQPYFNTGLITLLRQIKSTLDSFKISCERHQHIIYWWEHNLGKVILIKTEYWHII